MDWGVDHAELKLLRERCRANRKHLSYDRGYAPTQGQVGFFPLGVFESAQTRFSYRRVVEMILKTGGKPYGLDKAVPGIVYRGKIYLPDGNHKAYVSHVMNFPYLPARIIEVFDDRVQPAAFRAELSERSLGHFHDFKDRPVPPLDLCDLINDPNLYLARLHLHRVKVDFAHDAPKILDHGRKRRAIVVKINGDRPFLEIKMGDALRRANRHWDDARPDSALSYAEQKKDLAILKRESTLNPKSGLNGILFLDRPRKYPKLGALIHAHTTLHGCGPYLSHGVSE